MNVPTSQFKKPKKVFRLALCSATTAVFSNAKIDKGEREWIIVTSRVLLLITITAK